MARINARTKGAKGEREAAEWLQKKFGLENTPERNLEQVRHGGFDLIGFQPFAFEVKRCQTLSLRTWWVQAVTSTNSEYSVPVVMYRQNRQPWRFLISAQHLGIKKGYLVLEELEFVKWATKFLSLQG